MSEGDKPSREVEPQPGPFDIETIRQLVRLMSKHELTQLDLQQGDQRIRLRRGTLQEPVQQEYYPAPGIQVPTPAAPTPTVSAPPEPAAAAPEPETKQYHEITSPTPGTFYSAANPDADPFVQVGSRVQPETVVCIIEAMKVFNEIQAECSGVIVEILVENQQPVEYGTPLFRVDPNG